MKLEDRKLTFIDLFAGCGGLSEGFLQTYKFEAIAHVEWELPMVETLRNRLIKKWGHNQEEAKKRVVLFDVQKTEELLNGEWEDETLEKFEKYNHDSIIRNGLKSLIDEKGVDIIIGGPPCQAYSIHGRATDPNSMQDDYRNYLFESFAKIVSEINPKVFIFENVPGILSAHPGGIPITKRIFEEFSKIGYEILEPDKLGNAIFDASEFKVPQNRKRVIIIGVNKNANINLIDFYQKLNSRKSPDNKVTVRDAIGNFPRILPIDKNSMLYQKGVSHYVENDSLSQHIPRYNNERDVSIFRKWTSERMNYIPHAEKVRFYFETVGKKTLYAKYRSLEWNSQSPTIVAHLYKDGLMFIHPDPEQSRSITIREAASLMTFPLDYEFIGSNASCYKMIGNAVPVNFAKNIAEIVYETIKMK